jgi:hypothetical protein
MLPLIFFDPAASGCLAEVGQESTVIPRREWAEVALEG